MSLHQACQRQRLVSLRNLGLRRARDAFGGRGAQRVRDYGSASNAPTSLANALVGDSRSKPAIRCPKRLV